MNALLLRKSKIHTNQLMNRTVFLKETTKKILLQRFQNLIFQRSHSQLNTLNDLTTIIYFDFEVIYVDVNSLLSQNNQSTVFSFIYLFKNI